MKSFLYIVIIPLVMGIITSCDCIQSASGVVIDKNSKLPIDSVTIRRAFIDHGLYTDRYGRFEFHSITGGLFSCPKFKIRFSKPGFETVDKVYPSCCSKNDTVLLTPKSN